MPRRTVTWIVTENGCHECTSHAPDMHGYPHVWKNGRGHNLHRILYEEANNITLPSNVLVRHTCDNRKCINLEHLVEGSHDDNMRDRNERNRMNPPIGERCGTHKLTREQILQIREMTGSQSSIARIFGVNQSQISRIKSKTRWRWLNDE